MCISLTISLDTQELKGSSLAQVEAQVEEVILSTYWELQALTQSIMASYSNGSSQMPERIIRTLMSTSNPIDVVKSSPTPLKSGEPFLLQHTRVIRTSQPSTTLPDNSKYRRPSKLKRPNQSTGQQHGTTSARQTNSELQTQPITRCLDKSDIEDATQEE